MLKIIIFFIMSLLFLNTTFADISRENYKIITESLSKKTNYIDKIKYLESLELKDNLYISELKDNIIKENLNIYIKDHYFENIKNGSIDFKKSFMVLQKYDYEAGISPYYLGKLKSKLIEDNLNKNNLFFKSYVYILYSISENLKNNPELYNKYIIKSELKYSNKISDESKKVLSKINLNIYSKYDLIKLKKYLIKNRISYDSKLFKAFIEYENFLNSINGYVGISNILNKKQEKNLSCEINSTSIYLSYLLGTEISEDKIYSKIKIHTKDIQNIENKYYWGNPHKEFVGNINGNQRSDLGKMTGYGIYAGGLIDTINNFGVKSSIGTFDKDIILKSLYNKNPIIFWYLIEGNNGYLNTNPIYWNTYDGKKVKGYIGEHTGLIVGVDIDYYGDIKNVYFYEGKNIDVQVKTFEEIKYKASFFDTIIYKNDL